MRTEKVEGNQIVIRDGGACVKYDLALIEKQISKLESQLETWREYKRLLTPVAADNATLPDHEHVFIAADGRRRCVICKAPRYR